MIRIFKNSAEVESIEVWDLMAGAEGFFAFWNWKYKNVILAATFPRRWRYLKHESWPGERFKIMESFQSLHGWRPQNNPRWKTQNHASLSGSHCRNETAAVRESSDMFAHVNHVLKGRMRSSHTTQYSPKSAENMFGRQPGAKPESSDDVTVVQISTSYILHDALTEPLCLGSMTFMSLRYS